MAPFFGQQMWHQSQYCNQLGLISNPMVVQQPNVWGANCCMPKQRATDSLYSMYMDLQGFKFAQRQYQINLLQNDLARGNYEPRDFGSFFNNDSYSSDYDNDFYDERYLSADDPERAEKLKDAWGSKGDHLSQRFYDEVVDISDEIGCHPEDLMAVMYAESGLKPTAVNDDGGATGLIQFMPKTAKSLGTTTSKLKKMSAVEQLKYVKKYYLKAKRNSALKNREHLTGADLYSITFLPARADREVLTTRGEKYYEANKATDYDNDGDIDKKDLSHRVATKIEWA